MYLRPYKSSDAATIISWCENETEFRKWTGDRYPNYPITAEDMNRKYFDCNGDCCEEDNFYPMTACDDDGVVGHFILRYTGGDHKALRIGFVIVDGEKRGRGNGSKMIRLALEYGFRIAGADEVTIGVFSNNQPAYNCYLAAGFKVVDTVGGVAEVCGEKWEIIELAVSREDYFKNIG